jgi:hypothetical protein
MHSILEISCRRFGTKITSRLQDKNSCTLKIGRIRFAERSVSNYHCTVCSISAERRCYALRNGNLKLRHFNVTNLSIYRIATNCWPIAYRCVYRSLCHGHKFLPFGTHLLYKRGGLPRYLISHRLSLFYKDLHTIFHVCLLRTH